MKAETTTVEQDASSPEVIDVDLRDPWLAAFFAWLIPGAGHLYQGRTAKGILFMACILGTFFFGVYLGGGKVVYASMRPDDRRLPYLCQIGVGLPALPALAQAVYLSKNPDANPLWPGFMAPPALPGRGTADRKTLHDWQEEYHGYFELGTVYTMIAGLLNVLAIYDAWGGPLLMPPPGKRKDE